MNGSFQRFVARAKLTVLALLVIHVILFIILNADKEIELNLIYKRYNQNFLLIMLGTSVLSIFGWWLFRTSYKTLHQIRASRDRARIDQLEQQAAEQRAKAAMLQTKTSGGAVTVHVDNLGNANKPT